MTQKMYRVLNTFDFKNENKIVHEYTIVVDMNKNGHEVTTLLRSHDDVWAEDRRGEEIFSIIDTGNFVVFPKKEFAGDVQYDRLSELFILLSFTNKTEYQPLYKGTIEEIVLVETLEI